MAFVDLPFPITFPQFSLVSAFPSLATAATLDEDGDIVSFIFMAPETGSIKAAGFLVGTVTQNPTNGLHASIQSVDASGNPTGTDLAFRNVPTGDIASSTWVETGILSDDGTDGGTLVSVTVGDIISLNIEFETFVASDELTIIQAANEAIMAGGAPRGVPYGNVFNVGGGPGSWSKTANLNSLVAAIKYSDDEWKEMPGIEPIASISGATLTAATTPDEAGMRFTVPVPMRCNGLFVAIAGTTTAADFTAKLYDVTSGDVLGSGTVISNVGQFNINSQRIMWLPFSGGAVDLDTDQEVRAVIAGGTNGVRNNSFTLPSAAYRTALVDGASYTTRTDAGAWTDDSTKISHHVALSISAIDPVKSSALSDIQKSFAAAFSHWRHR